MHRQFGLLSPGKASSHSMALPNFFFLCAVFSRFHTTGCEAYSFTTDGYGILMYTQIWVRAVHMKGGQAKTNLYKSWLGGTEKNCLSPCPTRGSNPESSDLNSEALTTELHPWKGHNMQSHCRYIHTTVSQLPLTCITQISDIMHTLFVQY